jgi:hypothetical protein
MHDSMVVAMCSKMPSHRQVTYGFLCLRPPPVCRLHRLAHALHLPLLVLHITPGILQLLLEPLNRPLHQGTGPEGAQVHSSSHQHEHGGVYHQQGQRKQQL